jgi:spore coat protein U-like protein
MLRLFIVIFLLLIAGKAYAACNVTATGINFGNYDIFDTFSVDSSGTINITCDAVPLLDVTISIDPSLHSGVFNPRQMKNSSNPYLLNYNVYTDAAKRKIWGDGTGGTEVVMIKGTKQRKLTVYGSIPPGQNASTGTYTDLLKVTIVW